MEIVDYFHSLGKRSLAVILLPLLAVLVLGGVVFELNYKFQANALIAAPTLTGVRSAEGDGNQYSTELQSVIQAEVTTSSVLTEISRRTGVPINVLKAGLSVSRRKPSSFIVVSYASAKAKNVSTVARTAAEVTYGAIITYERRVSREPVDAEEARLQAAEQALAQAAQQIGTSDPTTAYIAARDQVARLEAQLAFSVTHGNPGAATQTQAALDRARNTQASLVSAVIQRDALIRQRDAARTARDDALQRYVKAQSRLDASDLATAIHVAVPKKNVPIKDMVIAAGAAGGVMLALLLFVQWVTEARRWSRLRRPHDDMLQHANRLVAT